tara:strand:+ start:1597 stop:1932 length:336 start_codon:yes stop_codon:yes gene_type:complete
MKGVEWSLLDDQDSVKFRGSEERRKGHFSPSHGVYETAADGLVRDVDGDSHAVSRGVKIKVLSDEEIEKHEGADWLLFVEEVLVRYRQGVESLRYGSVVAVLPDLPAEQKS